MAYSYVRYTGNGSTTNYTFSFPTISQDHIKVRVNGSLVTNWSFLNASTIQFAAAPANAAIIEIRRETPKESAIVNFTDGSVLLERDLDLLTTWQLYAAQETEDDLEDTIRVDTQGRFDAVNRRIINVANPINPQDVVTKSWAETGISSQLALATAQASAAAGSATAAAGSATAAAGSASAAATSASNASVSASNAATSAAGASGSALSSAGSASGAANSATNAASSANAAAGSASWAESSAISASNSAAAAAASFDSFDDRYLGAKATAPALDNDSMPLMEGAIYWNSTSNKLFVFSGFAWGEIAPQQAVGTQQLTATGGQSLFTISGGYNPNAVYVYINGVLLDFTDYTATNGSTVVLSTAATAGDTLRIVTFYSPVDTVSIRDAAAASAVSAANSAAAAATSASNASTSEGTATTQAGIATTQATNAATSATNASSSASAASTSATNASSSASAAATSATNAASSATTATTQASAAAASAAAASAVVLGNEPVRPLVRPSLLLDFANTRQLDPRITFTRASTATFYDGRTVAKAEENLLTFSQEFDNAAWTKTAVSVTANASAAPDGTATAEALIESVASGGHFVDRSISGIGVVSGTVYTISVFALKNTRDRFLLYTASNGGGGTFFDLTNGVTLGTQGVAPSSSSITPVGNGWYRCTITVSATTTTTNSNAVQIYLVSAGTTFSYTGDGTSGIFIWGAQLEQRSTVTAYTATTTAPITNYIPALRTAAAGVPRFEHNPVTGVSLGLEIEEQRANLFQRSEEFDNAYWTKTRASITVNTIVAPSGELTGDKIVENTDNNSHFIQGTSVSVTAGTTYTFTIYAKAAERAWLRLTGNTVGLFGPAFYNLQTGTLGTVASGTTATITPVGNGWYRCTFTRAETTNSNLDFLISMVSADNTTAYQGNGFSGIFVWGAQLEAGAFATSYIPTVASQVTRSADAAVMTGTNFSSWYRQDEGTLYAEAGKPLSNFTSTRIIAEIGDGTVANRINLNAQSTTTNALFAITTNSVAVAAPTVSGVFASGYGKVAGGYVVDNVQLAGNGVLATADTSCQIPVVNRMTIGDINAGGLIWNGTIKKIAFYPARVTNAQLQSLTTV